MSSLHQLVLDSAVRHPERPAVVADDGPLRYSELDRQAGRLAARLRRYGVRAGDRVVIWSGKSAATVTAMQAVLRLGAAYVPADATVPPARVTAVAGDCAARLILTTAERLPLLADGMPEGAASLELAPGLPEDPVDGAQPRINEPVQPDDLAYVLYTSASTGPPKGVCISHRNARAFLDWAVAELDATPQDRFANHAPFTSGLSVLDLYAAFSVGASVHLVAPELAHAPAQSTAFLHDREITVWHSVPSALTLMIREGGLLQRPAPPRLRAVLVAGQPCPIASVRALAGWTTARLLTLYGRTETNVCAYHEVRATDLERDRPVPIGSACSGDTVWARRRDGSVCGVGEQGELVVDGPTVMLGYWGAPRRPMPYPTGDIVTVREDGSFEYVGRSDDQVKVLGEAPAAAPALGDGVAADGTADAHGTADAGAVPPVLASTPEPVLSWVLSGTSPTGLRDQAGRLAEYVRDHPYVPLADLAHALLARPALRHRAAVVGTGRDDLLGGLTGIAEDADPPHVVRGGPAGRVKAVLVFPGQGWQWPGMGRRLLAQSPVFAQAIEECSAAVADLAGWSPLDVLRENRDLDRVEVIQPVMFAVMVALARTWQAMGLRPAAVMGHSQGEIAAACICGALDLREAARVVVARSAALRELAGDGAMVSVLAPLEEVQPRLGPELTVAVVNGPSFIVVSGPQAAAGEFLARCRVDGIPARRIPVDYASHSAQVERVRSRMLADLAGVTAHSTSVPLCSTVTGAVLDGARLDAAYWYDNLRRTVRFDTATRTLLDTGHTLFVEISGHPVLTPGIEQTIDTHAGAATTVATLRRRDDGPARLHTAAAQAWTYGVDIRWPALLPGVATADGAVRVLAADVTTYVDHQRFRLGRNGPAERAGVGSVGS